MIQHIVLFQLRPEATEEEVAAAIATMRALPAQIPEIRGYRVSSHLDGREAPYSLALVSTFATRESMARYEAHPAHVAFVEQFLPIARSTIIFDSEEADEAA